MYFQSIHIDFEDFVDSLPPLVDTNTIESEDYDLPDFFAHIPRTIPDIDDDDDEGCPPLISAADLANDAVQAEPKAEPEISPLAKQKSVEDYDDASFAKYGPAPEEETAAKEVVIPDAKKEEENHQTSMDTKMDVWLDTWAKNEVEVSQLPEIKKTEMEFVAKEDIWIESKVDIGQIPTLEMPKKEFKAKLDTRIDVDHSPAPKKQGIKYPEFSKAVFAAGMLQMLLASIGFILYTFSVPAFAFFPQWAWGAFPGVNNDLEIRTGFMLEYICGLALVFLSAKTASKMWLTVWIWAAMILTFVHMLGFMWRMPTLNNHSHHFYTASNMFCISFSFHSYLIYHAQNHYVRHVEKALEEPKKCGISKC